MLAYWTQENWTQPHRIDISGENSSRLPTEVDESEKEYVYVYVKDKGYNNFDYVTDCFIQGNHHNGFLTTILDPTPTAVDIPPLIDSNLHESKSWHAIHLTISDF